MYLKKTFKRFDGIYCIFIYNFIDFEFIYVQLNYYIKYKQPFDYFTSIPISQQKTKIFNGPSNWENTGGGE